MTPSQTGTSGSQPQAGTAGAVGTSGSAASPRRSLPATGSSLPLMIFTALGAFAAAGALRAYRLSL